MQGARASGRRRFLGKAGALALALAQPGLLRAAAEFPIADSHSHIGLKPPGMASRSLKAEMQAAGVMLLSWNIVGDGRWTKRTDHGIKQQSTPAGGEQARYFRQKLDAMREYLARNELAHVRSPADIDAARTGTPHVVIAVEGAGFVEDGLDGIDRAHADGLRHLQLVHYIRNALGDFQTEPPEHGALTPLGMDVVKACNRLGILVDLAHATNPVIDKALEISTAPIIWSHSAIASTQQAPRSLSRLLSLEQARKIARGGGAVGLWSIRSKTRDVPDGYAGELLRMVDAIGPEHVMFGTDLDGVGKNGMLEHLADLRKVADALRTRGADEKTMKAVCFDNYARCLRAAMEARRA